MAVVRRAEVCWKGNLVHGQGSLSSASSGAYKSLPVTWASRTETADGRTSPEELLASAHATCFAMAFSNELSKTGSEPEELDVACEVGFDRVDGKWTVQSSRLTVKGCVPGMDESQFRSIADQAKDNCPISRALSGNVSLSVEATLETSVPA